MPFLSVVFLMPSRTTESTMKGRSQRHVDPNLSMVNQVKLLVINSFILCLLEVLHERQV